MSALSEIVWRGRTSAYTARMETLREDVAQDAGEAADIAAGADSLNHCDLAMDAYITASAAYDKLRLLDQWLPPRGGGWRTPNPHLNRADMSARRRNRADRTVLRKARRLVHACYRDKVPGRSMDMDVQVVFHEPPDPVVAARQAAGRPPLLDW